MYRYIKLLYIWVKRWCVLYIFHLGIKINIHALLYISAYKALLLYYNSYVSIIIFERLHTDKNIIYMNETLIYYIHFSLSAKNKYICIIIYRCLQSFIIIHYYQPNYSSCKPLFQSNYKLKVWNILNLTGLPINVDFATLPNFLAFLKPVIWMKKLQTYIFKNESLW